MPFIAVLDFLQSAFSLTIRLFLISACAIAKPLRYVTIMDWDETIKDGLWTLCSKQNPPSAQKKSNQLVNFTTVDRSLIGSCLT